MKYAPSKICTKCKHHYDVGWDCQECTDYSKFIPYVGPNNVKTEEKKAMESTMTIEVKKNYTAYAANQYLRRKNFGLYLPEIKDVIFNPPATIVFWDDGTKSVVKCENEIFDPEKGLAMAISKKALGNKYEYFNHFKRWTKKYYKTHDKFVAKNPPQVEFTMTGCSIDTEELGELLGTTKDGKKLYLNPNPVPDVVSPSNPRLTKEAVIEAAEEIRRYMDNPPKDDEV